MILFMLFSILFTSLLGEAFGYDRIAGVETYKNVHLIIGLIMSILIVSFIVSKMSVLKLTRGSSIIKKSSSASGKFSKQSKRERSMKYDFSNDFIDDIPEDYIDDMSYDFVDDIPSNFIDDLSEDFTRKKPKKKEKGFFDLFIGNSSEQFMDQDKVWTIDKAKIMYREGGLISQRSFAQIRVTKKGLYYDKKLIAKDNIETRSFKGGSKSSDNNPEIHSLIRFLLLGSFALLVPKNKSNDSKVLAINYREFGQTYTLVLEGDSVTEIDLALRFMKNQ